jgi:hypothetical protein
VLLLSIDGYALADRRTGSHFFVYELVDWSCYIGFRFMDWLELSIIVKMLCPDEKLASFEVLALTLQRETHLQGLTPLLVPTHLDEEASEWYTCGGNRTRSHSKGPDAFRQGN